MFLKTWQQKKNSCISSLKKWLIVAALLIWASFSVDTFLIEEKIISLSNMLLSPGNWQLKTLYSLKLVLHIDQMFRQVRQRSEDKTCDYLFCEVF